MRNQIWSKWKFLIFCVISALLALIISRAFPDTENTAVYVVTIVLNVLALGLGLAQVWIILQESKTRSSSTAKTAEEILREYGADIEPRTQDGESPRDTGADGEEAEHNAAVTVADGLPKGEQKNRGEEKPESILSSPSKLTGDEKLNYRDTLRVLGLFIIVVLMLFLIIKLIVGFVM